MSDDRTEPAKLRQEGRIAKSPDFNYAVMLSVAVFLLFLFVPSVIEKLKVISIATLGSLDPHKISNNNLESFMAPYIKSLFDILLPILLIMMVCGILLNYAQVGPLLTFQTIKPKFNKFSPTSMFNNFKRHFVPNVNNIVELLKSFIKMAVIGGVAFSVIIAHKQQLLTLLGADLQLSLGVIGTITFKILTQVCIVLIIFGILDKKYQLYQFEKSIKMTKQEIKDEQRNAEGDPKIKAKVRKIQMQYAMQRMMGAIPKAHVVVTNPTHYAVALKYDPEVAPAPQVVAKGVDFVAFRIKEAAKHHNVPIIENKPLARTLYKIVPLDGLIPAELYVAVAEVLAYVYKTKGKIR